MNNKNVYVVCEVIPYESENFKAVFSNPYGAVDFVIETIKEDIE